jgi:hypothetical protein
MHALLERFLLIAIATGMLHGRAAAQTSLIGGDLFSAGNWSNGLPSVGNPGTISVNGTMNGVFDFNQTMTGSATITIASGTITANTANFFNGATASGTWTSFAWTQTGGTVNIGGTLFTPNFRQNYTLAGGSIAATTNGTIGSYNSGVFNQTGGTITGASIVFSDGAINTTNNFTGGQALQVARLTANSLNKRIEISGSHNVIFTPTIATADIGTTNGGTINFQTGWTGSWTRDNFTLADWQTVLTKTGMLYNGTQITVGDVGTVIKVFDAGAVGSRVSVVPEPLGLIGCAVIFGWAGMRSRTARRRR